MSDQPLPPNDDSTQGQEAISRNGNPYRVDKQEPIDIEKKEDNQGVMEKHDFSIDVNWPPTKDLVDTTEKVKRIAAITRYKLLHAGPGVYKLWFTNAEHYDYYFTDKTNDHYRNDTYLNRDHYIDYGSRDPTIVKFTGV